MKNDNFDLSEFGMPVFKASSKTFPIEVVSYDQSGNSHSVTGIDLSSPNRSIVSIYLRPLTPGSSEYTKSRAPISKFATPDSAINSFYVAPGGLILVEGAYSTTNDPFLYSAARLKILSKYKLLTFIESPVWARLNNPFKRGDKLNASVDVVTPDAKTTVPSIISLDTVCKNMVGREAHGEPFAVIKLTNLSTSNSFTEIVRASRKFDENARKYIKDDPAEIMEKFWKSHGSDWTSNLHNEVAENNVKLEVFPGIRYYYIARTLDYIAKHADKHALRFKLNSDNVNGFMTCSVALRAHSEVSSDKYPIGCYPIYPYGEKPRHLSTL